jgi:hypothetical protein
VGAGGRLVEAGAQAGYGADLAPREPEGPRDDLAVVPEAISLARATLTVIRRNLARAFGYNIAAIALAAAGFLNPLIAGAAMAASSAFVVASSIRLRRFGHTATPDSQARRQATRGGPVQLAANPEQEASVCPG